MVFGMETLLVLLIGLAAGVCSGLFGIGGAIVIIPLLIFVMKIPQSSASAISLAALILPVGILAVWQYWQAGKLLPEHLKIAGFLAVGLFFGGYLGAKLAVHTPDALLRKLFACLLVLVAIKLWVKT
jgi:uncharacterized membrane protein YfcA